MITTSLVQSLRTTELHQHTHTLATVYNHTTATNMSPITHQLLTRVLEANNTPDIKLSPVHFLSNQ
jgi:hypothetical protein